MSKSEPATEYDLWRHAAVHFLNETPAPLASDIVDLLEREVVRFSSRVEKELCAVLGKEWHPDGRQSIKSLADEIRTRLSETEGKGT